MFDSSLGLKNGLVLHESLLKLCRVAGGVLRKKFNLTDIHNTGATAVWRLKTCRAQWCWSSVLHARNVVSRGRW